MRIQYAVVCHHFEDGQWFGVTNLLGVCHKLVAPASGPGSRVPLRLVVSLIDGEIGWHKVWVTVRYPSLRIDSKIPPLDIDWDEDSPTFFTIFEVPLEVTEEGVYEFTILADGEPLGTVPLPVEIAAVPS
ncbi:MAG: hypothetical protein IIC82_02260 [Chloroflexi bacterium]|nr:hypothetical protein [Chloroflexota bacterium]